MSTTARTALGRAGPTPSHIQRLQPEARPKDSSAELREDSFSLPTLEEQLASVRSLLDMMTNNPFDRSSSLGALCWSIREHLRGMMAEQTGEWLASLLVEMEEAAVVDERGGGVSSNQPNPHLSTDGGDGATGNTIGTNTSESYDTSYTFREAVQATLDPEVKDIVFDGTLPQEYRRFAQSFYSAMEQQQGVSTPTPFDIEALPGLDDIPSELVLNLAFCDSFKTAPNRAIDPPASEPPTTTTTTTAEPEETNPGTQEDEDDAPVTDPDAPPVDDADSEDAAERFRQTLPPTATGVPD